MKISGSLQGRRRTPNASAGLVGFAKIITPSPLQLKCLLIEEGSAPILGLLFYSEQSFRGIFVAAPWIVHEDFPTHCKILVAFSLAESHFITVHFTTLSPIGYQMDRRRGNKALSHTEISSRGDVALQRIFIDWAQATQMKEGVAVSVMGSMVQFVASSNFPLR